MQGAHQAQEWSTCGSTRNLTTSGETTLLPEASVQKYSFHMLVVTIGEWYPFYKSSLIWFWTVEAGNLLSCLISYIHRYVGQHWFPWLFPELQYPDA